MVEGVQIFGQIWAEWVVVYGVSILFATFNANFTQILRFCTLVTLLYPHIFTNYQKLLIQHPNLISIQIRQLKRFAQQENKIHKSTK